MAHGIERISREARAELERCVRNGLTAHGTRLRLELRGVVIPDRTATRWMEKVRSEERRVRDLEAIGRGLGSVQLDATAAAEALRVNLPGWRQKQAGVLRDLFAEFLNRPTAVGYCGLVVGLNAILLGSTLTEAQRQDG